MKSSVTTLQLAALWEGAKSDDPLSLMRRRLDATIDYTTEFLMENSEDSDLYQEMSDAHTNTYDTIQWIKEHRCGTDSHGLVSPDLAEQCVKIADSIREIFRLRGEISLAQKLPAAL